MLYIARYFTASKVRINAWVFLGAASGDNDAKQTNLIVLSVIS